MDMVMRRLFDLVVRLGADAARGRGGDILSGFGAGRTAMLAATSSKGRSEMRKEIGRAARGIANGMAVDIAAAGAVTVALALAVATLTPPLVALAASPAEAAARPWRGDVVYFADAALFTDCASGRRWPMASAGDIVALQHSYLQWQSAPGAPLLMSFEGRLDTRESMEGPPREQIVVERFESAQPGMDCATLASKGQAAN
jgi:uncharacterized lipoprotein NlpE involved in copper resistance